MSLFPTSILSHPISPLTSFLWFPPKIFYSNACISACVSVAAEKHSHKHSLTFLPLRNEVYAPSSWVCIHSVQFSHSVVSDSLQPMDCRTPGLPVHHQLLEFTQTHVHWVGDAIQPSHPLLSPSPPALNFSQHQGLFQWVTSSHQVAKALEFQLHQSLQWTPRTGLL